MKRAGHLVEQIAARENLLRAFARAARGKRRQPEVVAFGRHLEHELQGLAEALLRGDIRLGTGLTFLGVRVFPDRLRLDAHSKRRLAAKYRRYRDEYQEGLWSERDLQPRLTALFAFAQQADSYALRRSLIARFGDIAQ